MVGKFSLSTFARSDPGPIGQLQFTRSSPYTPGCLAGVNLPPHIAAKMAGVPGGVNLDASGIVCVHQWEPQFPLCIEYTQRVGVQPDIRQFSTSKLDSAYVF